MKFIRPIAAILFYLFRGLAILYLLISTLVLIVLVLKNLLPEATWLPIKIYEASYSTGPQMRFDILIPATNHPFLLGRFTPWGIIEIVGGLSLYALFFFLTSRIFNSFRAERLFTSQAIKNLMTFAKASFILPPIFLFFLHLHPNYLLSAGEILVTGLHFLLAIFALFQAAIFSEGFSLQQEQDLTI